jgi:hypothetical protein
MIAFHMRWLLFVSVSIVLYSQASWAQRPRPELVQRVENPKLPRVLILGDSISIGYLRPLREILKDKANVQHPPENCLSSRHTLQKIEQYLGDKPWDIIVFNCGIHDLTYRDAKRKFLKPKDGGKIDVPIDEYQENLEKIVVRLEKTGAKLIWCTTSPVGDHVDHRQPADVTKYNAEAKVVMEKHCIQIVDPHRELSKLGKPKLTADGVHFTRQGYREIASRLSSTIANALMSRSGLLPKS